ncbi:unnamed protein product [Adineta ricciae]|uniref:Condensin complex subunit 2 n=1 Tax=Adineta ricciae TaxID=249248 RepID=A0A814B5J9_ADIRI|nr:unnamed protein product [Adineta ricciae]CAF1244382.1 unnamed protein product [Adineta ricciae]
MNEDENECLPIPRRSLVNRKANHFGSDNETSPIDRRQSRLLLNASISTDSGVDENVQTPVQLIALYEKTLELASKNKINAKNAFHFPLLERLPEILDLIAFDDKSDSFSENHHEPNFVKAGSVIDTSAKIYGYRVDALHTETQKLNGSIQQQDEDDEESQSIQSDPIEITKKLSQRSKPKASSYLTTDLSTISLAYELDFHPFQPSNMCQWPGGVGDDSIYADMVSYTMYSSSDYPLINGFINLNSPINREYDDNERILDVSMKTIYDLIPLREVIQDHEEHDHVLGCQILREFSFNENCTASYIETIDECSVLDRSLMDVSDDYDAENEVFSNGLSELRDDPFQFCFQELQSAHTCPTTMASMDVTLAQSKASFVDQIPHLLREMSDPSDYSYFDYSKLKLFAGPYLWRYTNLLPDIIESTSNPEQRQHQCRAYVQSTHRFKLNLTNTEQNVSLTDLMFSNSWTRKILKRRKRKVLSNTLHRAQQQTKNHYQLRLSRKSRPVVDLSSLNYFPDLNVQMVSTSDDLYSLNDEGNFQFDPPDPISEEVHYEFIRPVHYDKIEFDRNFTKIDAKKLQLQLFDVYTSQHTNTSNPVSLSTICVKLLDQGMISYDKDQLVSAFYCMLNNCNKNQLYMKSNSQRDDLIIQKQPFVDSTQLTYSQAIN